MQKGEEHEAKIYQKHYNILNEIAVKQNDAYEKLSFLSPFIPVRFLSMDIANTSDNLHWKFTRAAEDYRIKKQEFLNYDIKDNSKFGERGYKMSVEKFKNLPKFSFTPPSLSEILQENTQNLLFFNTLVSTSVCRITPFFKKNISYVFKQFIIRNQITAKKQMAIGIIY